MFAMPPNGVEPLTPGLGILFRGVSTKITNAHCVAESRGFGGFAYQGMSTEVNGARGKQGRNEHHSTT